jgi:hypothetical protein
LLVEKQKSMKGDPMTFRLRPLAKLALLLAVVMAALTVVSGPVMASHNPSCGREYIYYTDSTYTYNAGYKYVDCDCNVTVFGQITPYYEVFVESCW